MGVLRRGSNGIVRKNGTSAARSGTVHPSVNPYSMYLGYHADESNQVQTPALINEIFDRCHVSPESMNGAMALWRHINDVDADDMEPERLAAAALDCEEPTIILIPFTTAAPGTNDEAQNSSVLAALAAKLALYAGEDPIFGFGNLNADNFMPESTNPGTTDAQRATAWFALEAEAIKIIQDEGYRWCSTDDSGLTFLCTTMTERRAAWAAAGVTVADCEFHCVHFYVANGDVPVHVVLAEASLARISVTTPIRITEGAFDFLRSGESDEDRPFLFTEYEPGNTSGPGGSEYPAHSVTWTELLYAWFRTTGRHFLAFDWTMFARASSPGVYYLTSWGIAFTQDQDEQPAFVEPAPLDLWFKDTGTPNAMTKAYSLRLSNGGDTTVATAAAERVEDGYLFTIA